MSSRSPSPSMSVLSALADNVPGKTVMAEMPVVLQSSSSRLVKQKSPQQKLDNFWRKFTTEAPGKGMLFPTFVPLTLSCVVCIVI